MFRIFTRICSITAFLGALLVLGATGYAQVFSGSITGTVTDSSGAVVSDANVVVANTGTNASYPTKTTGSGIYTVPYLEPGEYSVSVTKSGFQTFTVSSVHLDPAQTVREDVKLTVGATSAVVQVNASTLQLQTDNATVAGLTPASVIDIIPNLTNNPFAYSQLQNGVLTSSLSTETPGSFNIGLSGRGSTGSYGIDGAQALENDLEVDGLPIVGQGDNEPSIVPNLEGIQEVQVLSNNFSAEYGHGAGIISITTKSGTNKFHGQVSYENRNEALMANTTANKQQNIRRPAFKVDDLGGEVDGPIRRDHIFFSSSFHWLAHNYGQTNTETVPTVAERAGDFGAIVISGSNGLPTPVQLYNPFSVTEINSNLYQRAEFPKSPNCGAYGCGDIIPNPNSVGLTLLSYYPKPNATPTDPYGDNNFRSYTINTIRTELMNNRIDYKRGRHSIYGSGGFDFGDIENPFYFTPDTIKGLNDAPTQNRDRNPYAQIGDTIVFSPTLFMDVRYGAVRLHTDNLVTDYSGYTNYAGVGIAPATQSLFAVPGAAPTITSVGAWTNLTDSQFVNKNEHDIFHSFDGSVTKVKGNWTFKAGSQFHVTLANFTDLEEATANLGGCCASDVGGYTAQYINAAGSPQGSFNTLPQQNGYNGAMVLVGEGVWFVRPGANLKPAYAAKYLAFYSQNDWKATPKLTINLGVRWELQPGITERHNRLAGYDFSKKNPFGYQGVIDFPGTNGYSRNLWDTEWNNWTPHLGVAYQLTHTLVARGGFAITYLPSNSGYFSSPNDLGEATWASGNTGAQTYGPSPHGIPTEMITDPAPLIAATQSNAAAPQTYGVSEAYFDRNFKNALEQQADAFLEKSFGGRSQWIFSAGWAGTYGNHIFTRNLAFQNAQTISASNPALLSSWRQTWINSNGTTQPYTQQVSNPYQPASGPLLPFQNQLAGATIQQFIEYLQYPLLYSSGAGENGTRGFSSYNSLQTHFAHNSKALYLDVNYTWSKALLFAQSIVAGGNISNLDLLCNRCNKNYSATDTPHRIVITSIIQSPFSAGQMWASQNRAVRGALGGWSISPVFIMNDGQPVTLSGLSNQFTGRVNYVGSKGSVPLVLPKSYRIWYNGVTKVTLPCGVQVTPSNFTRMKYNPCAFGGPTVTTPNGTILADEYWYPNGNQTNGNIRGPGRTNLDASLRRTFNLAEGFRLDITAATTDVFNHPERSSVNSGGVGGTDVVNNPANGQIVGLATGGGYGTSGVGSYDRRQVELIGRILF